MFRLVSAKMGGVPTEADWERLGRRIVAARVARGMHNQKQFAQATGLSTRFLSDLENGKRTNYDQASLTRVEQVLGWTDGSVDTVLAGGEPTRTTHSTDEHPGDEDEFADLELEVRMILELKLSDSDKQALIAEAWRLRERQLAARRRLEEQQATERRRLINTWMRRAQTTNGNEQPAT